MKRSNKSTAAGLLLLVLILLISIFVPKWLLQRNYHSHSDIVKTVPQSYYTASNTAMAKRKSELLSSLDRMKLITGVWDSTSSEAKVSDALLNESAAVQMAKLRIEYLYENGLYPCSLTSDFNNWYSWSAKLTSYQDNTFHTYNTILWTITFTKYDNSTIHTILLTDDGLLLAAQVNEKQGTKSLSLSDSKNWDTEMLFGDKKIQIDSVYGVSQVNLYQSLRSAYSTLPVCSFNKQSCYLVTLYTPDYSKESYVLYQYEDDDHYGIGLISPEP